MKFREHGDYWLFVDYDTAMQTTPCSLLLANDPAQAEMRQWRIHFFSLTSALVAVDL